MDDMDDVDGMAEKSEEERLEDIRMENELKRIKLSLEHGMDMTRQLIVPELPPELEGQFLDYIQRFEDEYALRKKILIYDLANRPEWKPVDSIPDSQIDAELANLRAKLSSYSITVDSVCAVQARELYRFITEELFNEETNDIRVEGMMHAFLYEEYHPNHVHDITTGCTELIKEILSKETEWTPEFLNLADNLDTPSGPITDEAATVKLGHFRDAFSAFTLLSFDLAEITIDENIERASAMGSISYTGLIDGTTETLDFEGSCTFSLRYHEEVWVITGLVVPGIVL